MLWMGDAAPLIQKMGPESGPQHFSASLERSMPESDHVLLREMAHDPNLLSNKIDRILTGGPIRDQYHLHNHLHVNNYTEDTYENIASVHFKYLQVRSYVKENLLEETEHDLERYLNENKLQVRGIFQRIIKYYKNSLV